MHTEKYPRIGIGIMIKKGNQVLMGLRKGSHASGCWGFPGGKQHFGETMHECAQRELQEEIGLIVKNLMLVSAADEMKYVTSDNKHYVSIVFMGNYAGGTPEVKEPKKCGAWKWFDLDNLPKHILEGTRLALKSYFEKNTK